MKKLNVKNTLLLLIPVLIIIFNLVLYIQSFYFGDYGSDGLEYEFDSDYLVYIFCGIALLVPALMQFLNKPARNSYLVSGTVIGSLLGFYPLGVFFKALFKSIEKGEAFNYGEKQIYLYIGLIGCALLAYMIASLVEEYKKSLTD